MSYNTDHLHTAGKITVYTTFLGIVAFAIIFIFNLGEPHVKEAIAVSGSNATTSVTVANTPPNWTASTTEVVESSVTTPTNSGADIAWTALATDSNGEDYYLIICSSSSAPTAQSSAAPICTNGIQWAVSSAASSGVAVVLSTTTYEALPEGNMWFAWVCDANAGSPRCSTNYTNGTAATNSSPFIVNHRPTFTVFSDNSPNVPGQVVTFFSTSSDTDATGTPDTVNLIVCASVGFSTTTDSCTGTTLATSTVFYAADASSTYTIRIPTQDQNYSAIGYIIDNHGHEASGGAQGTDSTLTVSNAAPYIASSTISINGGSNLILTTEAGQTTGFTYSFTATDDNSCDAAGGANNDEIVNYNMSLFRNGSGNSSTTCPVTGTYNANNCYVNSVATTTWNFACTASTTSCTGNTDVDTVWDCTFPLWYIADPTDGVQGSSTQYGDGDWRSVIRAIDDDSATGTATEGSIAVDVQSFLAFALVTYLTIPYGVLEPGQKNDPLIATSTISATGNVGLDKDVTGTSMCTTYTGGTPCPNSATSTINAQEQVFATSTVAYAAATPLSSTTPQEVEINVPKSTSTSTQASASSYWGINVPGTITYAGSYTGQNTFTAKVGESAFW